MQVQVGGVGYVDDQVWCWFIGVIVGVDVVGDLFIWVGCIEVVGVWQIQYVQYVVGGCGEVVFFVFYCYVSVVGDFLLIVGELVEQCGFVVIGVVDQGDV